MTEKQSIRCAKRNVGNMKIHQINNIKKFSRPTYDETSLSNKQYNYFNRLASAPTLLGKEHINPWNGRFIRWKYENGNSPANLSNEHFYLLMEHEYLFARKMEWPCSKVLIDNINRYF